MTNTVLIVAIIGTVAVVGLYVYKSTRPPPKTAFERNVGAVTGAARVIAPFFI